jgi:regulator of nonsense transcripts 2
VDDATALAESNPLATERGRQLDDCDKVLLKLPNALTKESIDKLATDFCYVNNRGNRSRLSFALCSLPRNRHDVIPFYARLTATIGAVFSDVSTAVRDHVLADSQRIIGRKAKVVCAWARSFALFFLSFVFFSPSSHFMHFLSRSSS